jgi:hypothetical protein
LCITNIQDSASGHSRRHVILHAFSEKNVIQDGLHASEDSSKWLSPDSRDLKSLWSQWTDASIARGKQLAGHHFTDKLGMSGPNQVSRAFCEWERPSS